MCYDHLRERDANQLLVYSRWVNCSKVLQIFVVHSSCFQEIITQGRGASLLFKKEKKRKFIMCYDQSTRTRHQLTLCLLAVQFYHCPSEASVAAYTLTRRIRHVGFP